MNLSGMLEDREKAGRPVRVGLVGAGKFGTMFLAQSRRTTGIRLVGVADLAVDRARGSLRRAGWAESRHTATDATDACRSGATWLTEDAEELIASDGVDVIVEATGDPVAGVDHARACFRHGRHVVMANVEADALVGAMLAAEAERSGVVYSLAYGDQPALICEMVDWARASGFEVVAAGKGTRHLPAYHESTPRTVWEHYGFSPEQVRTGDFNPQMFNSFVDGTKSAIEMAAVANATGLAPPRDGLGFPPAGVDDLANVCRPARDGGALRDRGVVEVVSSLNRDGSPVARDIRMGVYVTVEATSDYVRSCFAEYGVAVDDSGAFAAMYRPFHFIGLELGISVASVAVRREPTGRPSAWRGDVVAVAKRDLAAGEVLDAEGGYTVWGRLVPAAASVEAGALPIGLARGARLVSPVPRGGLVRWRDVSLQSGSEASTLRREMEAAFRRDMAPTGAASARSGSATAFTPRG